MSSASALYFGQVIHRRFRPRVHHLAYRVFWLFLDLEEMIGLDRQLRYFSVGRFNLVSFDPRDHGDGSDTPLHTQIKLYLEQAGIELGQGAVRLLTMPRILGYVFNPISIYYCHHTDGRLLALVYEVTSTFKNRHSYVIPVTEADSERGLFAQSAAKALYVSPFMDMEMDYKFQGHVPSDVLDLMIDGHDVEGKLIHAAITAQRQPLTDRSLLRAVVGFQLMTIKVVAAIHWEALKLWLKRVPLTRQPSPPVQKASIQTHARVNRLDK